MKGNLGNATTMPSPAGEHRELKGITTSAPSLLPEVAANCACKRLVLSIQNSDWEILIYQQGEIFEACFFRWAIHHEHLRGSSFEWVRLRVDQRIRTLEAHHLQGADWYRVNH